MLDALNAPAAPVTILREDYRPPDWLIPEIALHFQLEAERTLVRATLKVTRNGAHDRPLVLDADGLELLGLNVDGAAAPFEQRQVSIVVALSGDSATVQTEVAINPRANTQLMGLYESGGMLCTQCEAQGFRRITPFVDRPDVLSTYRVRMEGLKRALPRAARQWRSDRLGRRRRRTALG